VALSRPAHPREEHPLSEHPTHAIAAAGNGLMTEHPPHPDPHADAYVELRLPRAEAEALLLAIDALQPLFERLRAEVAPAPAPEPEPEPDVAVEPAVQEDHLLRATRLARESLQEARFAIGERGLSADQRRAWQSAARRYVEATKRSVVAGRRSGRR
jgi:hypothetical protein